MGGFTDGLKTSAGALALALLLAPAAPAQAASGASLKARIAVLSAEAQRVAGANDIKKLQRAYGYYLDKGYWQEAADLFADDATFEWGNDGVYVGKARIHDYLVRQGGGNVGPGLPYGQFNHHMQLQPVVNVAADGTTAKARWRELALIGQFQKSASWGAGIYENDYVRQDGVWKIQALRFYPTFIAPYELGWARLAPGQGDWKTDVAAKFPPDRPSTGAYKTFPDIYVPPFHYQGSPQGPGDVDPPAPAQAVGAQGGLEQTVSAEARRLALVRSHDAVENLQGSYGYYIDKGLWTQAAALFSARGTYEWGQRGVYVGPAHIRKALGLMGPEGLQTGQLNDYTMLQPVIDVAPDNRTAKARWRSDVMLAAGGRGQWSEGVYENDYVNEGGVWKISRLHYYVTMVGDYEKGWVAGAIPLDPPSASVPPDAPPTEVYQSLPGVYLPPYHYKNPVSGE